jgi:hypothetical protein
MFVLARFAQLIETKAQAWPAKAWLAPLGAGSVRGYKTSTIKRITRHGSQIKRVTPGAKTSSRSPAVETEAG